MKVKNIPWKQINNFPMYFINTKGDVLSLRSPTPKYMKPRINTTGYYQVMLFDGEKVVPKCLHRLLAAAFIPNPNNLPYVNHIDGNKQNNALYNLEWCTASYNIKHAYDMGLLKSTRAIKVICVETNTEYESINKAGIQTGISESSICAVCKGKRKTAGGYHWRYVKEDANELW